MIEFEGKFECLRKNREKYITFSVPIKKELENGKTITYSLKYIDSFRFMSSSLARPLIIYLKFTAKNVELKTASLNVSLKDLMINK